MALDPSELATMVVAGHQFNNFESVFVENTWAATFDTFRFTTADIVEQPNATPPKNWRDLQFKPGDPCAIYLGGQLAANGVITSRQTAYEGRNKGVMLQGMTVSWWAQRASIVDDKSSYDGKNLEQAARQVIAPTGVGLGIVGQLDGTPFKQLQVQPGEQIGDFIERLARMRKAIVGSDHKGNFLLIGDHTAAVVGTLVEGINIKRLQATISFQDPYSVYILRSQSGGTDGHAFGKAGQQEARAAGSAPRYSPLVVPAEQPVWTQAELDARAQAEQKWREGFIVDVVATVQGWFVPGSTTQLWRPGMNVMLVAPMAMINQVLKLEQCIFQQDSGSGTLTSLHLVPPWKLGDKNPYDLTDPNAAAKNPDDWSQSMDPSLNAPTAPTDPPPDQLPPATTDPSAGAPAPAQPDPNPPQTPGSNWQYFDPT